MSNPAFDFDHIHIISQRPQDAASWYVQMFGADIVAETVAYAPHKFSSSLRQDPDHSRPTCRRSPHARPSDSTVCQFFQPQCLGYHHFGFIYHGDLRAFCDELRAKGGRFPWR